MKQTLTRQLRQIPGLVFVYRYGQILATLSGIGFRRRWGPAGLSAALPFSAARRLARYIWISSRIPGWTRGEEAVALAMASYSLPGDPVIVEIGSFLGSSAILLAGARKLRKSGMVHCVDPFDASGDAFSVPIYRQIHDSLGVPLRQHFDENIRQADLAEWVKVHSDIATRVAKSWRLPVDLLFLDANQSYAIVRETYQSWLPFLKPGGILAVHNSSQQPHHEDHDGSMRLVEEAMRPPMYTAICCIGTTTFARKIDRHGS